MRVSSRRTLTLNLACTVVLAIVISVSGTPQNVQQRVPFVGCPSDGQAGYVKPPREGTRAITMRDVPAKDTAYYKGASAPGAFGPRGWHCHVWYGSDGGVLLITPAVLDSAPGSAWPPKTSGQAVELVFHDSGASGRYEVAKYALLFFPQTAASFIGRVNEGLDVPISRRSLQPFVKDSIKVISGTMAEFVTPSNSAGFGTEQYLQPSSDAISGIAFLDQSSPFGPNFIAFRVRLNAAASQLKSALLQLNRDCIAEGRGCSSR